MDRRTDQSKHRQCRRCNSLQYPAHANTQVMALNQETVAALRKAYPEEESRPEDVAELIERTEKDLAKSITTNIHASTRAVSRAQKTLAEAMEAKKKHRTAWMEYLKEGLKAWVGYIQKTADEDSSECHQGKARDCCSPNACADIWHGDWSGLCGWIAASGPNLMRGRGESL